MRPNSILIVDNNYRFLNDSIEYFTSEIGVNLVTWAITPQDAVNRFFQFNPELVILDIGMSPFKGQELSAWFKSQVNAPKVMITSFYDCEDYRNYAKEMRADGFMKKVNYMVAYPELILHLNQDLEKICRENNYLLN